MAEHLASIFGTEKDRVNCPFYFKIGVCRHGDRCSRLHNRPTASQTLLLANMYQSPDAGFHGGVDQHGNIQQSDPRKLQEHFEVCAGGHACVDTGLCFCVSVARFSQAFGFRISSYPNGHKMEFSCLADETQAVLITRVFFVMVVGRCLRVPSGLLTLYVGPFRYLQSVERKEY
jgi:hypothetical protein